MSLKRLVSIILVIWLFSFSSAGNASAGPVTYTYDDANRLVGISNSVGSMSYSYDIVGNRLKVEPSIPDISVIPSSVGFGDVTVGTTSLPATLTISNIDVDVLDVNGMSFIGTYASMFHMSLSGPNPCPQVPFSLSFQESCTVELTFGPTATGAKSASFHISSNDPNTSEFDIPLGAFYL